MNFQDRVAQNPGRVKLMPVSGQNNVFDMTLEDGSGTASYPAGTPLNKATFDQFKAELTEMIANAGTQGAKGDKGEKGDPGIASGDKTFLVGTESTSGVGWYKLGSVTLSNYMDYHAKIAITATYYHTQMPIGLLGIEIRRGNGVWDVVSVKWEDFRGQNPNYIVYYADTSGTVTFYGYIPQQYAYYRVDIIRESNREKYTNLFQPPVAYGEIFTTRFSSSEPTKTGYPERKAWNFYFWTYTDQCTSDKIVSCSKSVHGLNTVQGAVIVPRATATSTSGLSGYSNITSGTCRYGITVSGTTLYVAFDDGTFEKGFYCLIYGE